MRSCLIVLLPVFLCSCATTYRQYNVAVNSSTTAAEKAEYGGDLESALELYRNALSEYEAAGNDTGALLCLERIGWIRRERGEYGEALELFRKALPIGKRINGDASEIEADMGDVFMFSGDMERAREEYGKTLESLKGFQFPTSFAKPPSTARVADLVRKSKAFIHAHVNLGTMCYFQKKNDESLVHLDEARRQITRITLVADHFFYGWFVKLPPDFWEGVGFCHTMRGAVLGETGRFKDAYAAFTEGEKCFKRGNKRYGLLVNRALRAKTEFMESGPAIADDRKMAEYDRFLDEAESCGAQDIVWRMSFCIGKELAVRNRREKARGYFVRAIESLELTRSRLREDSVKQMFAASVQDVYAAMIGLCFDTGRYEEGFDYLERAKARAFLDVLAGRQFRAKWSVDESLVRTTCELNDRLEKISRMLQTAEGAEKTALQAEYRKLIVERRDIHEKIKSQSLQYAAASAVTTIPVRRIAERCDAATAMLSFFVDGNRTIIWLVRNGKVTALQSGVGAADLGGLVGDYRGAVASRQAAFRAELAGKLSAILVDPVRDGIAGAEKLLIVPSGSLHYLPFASLFSSGKRYLVEDAAITTLPNASSMFFADSKSASSNTSLFAVGNPARTGKEGALPFAEHEVKAIAGKYQAKIVLMGKEAAETAVKEKDLGAMGVMHFAAHGRYNARYPMTSALLLAADDRNDGNLEAYEIFGLNLNPVLVVLSACQSGLGRVEGGDDVQSVNRAFMYAGARNVVASLWNVSDESTCRLMEYFYDALKEKPVSQALRQAQLRLMKEFPDPYFWAPFYVTGLAE